jgi:hypothetical protein
VRFQSTGEADECGCPQCRGVLLPDWLGRLDQPVGEMAGEHAEEVADGDRLL